jgi:osmotically inducible lipoprotein OsmB
MDDLHIWRQIMKRITLTATLLFSLFALGACGTTTGERAASGAGIGAGVGAVGGLLLGAPLEGALIGGAVGAGTGALTTKKQINLGRPIWK